MNLSFFVEGIPVTQGSKRIVQPKGAKFARMIDVKSDKLKAWRAAIAEVARREWSEPQEGRMCVRLTFTLPRPKKPANDYPRGDLDKYTRAAFDALTGVIWHDDSQVVSVQALKMYATAPIRVGLQVEVIG